jgi:hypothetical protein
MLNLILTTMSEDIKRELGNVQQTDGLTGRVDNQAQTVNHIVGEAVNQPTTQELEHEQRRSMLASLRVASTTEVEPEEPALTVDEVGLFALGDIHALKGKQKCGKTTALKVCLAAWMHESQFRVTSGLEEPRVLYLDTEQKQSDVKLIVTDVIQMTGLPANYIDNHLQVYALRRRDFNLLLDDMRLLIDDFRPQVVIVDGIVEFVASFNDESIAKRLIHELLCISEERHLAMVCVLHTNKADEDHNMRGHLGTMLAQKAGTVLECKKDKGSSVITVTCSDSRHAEMPEWSIMFDEEGCIMDADERRRQALEQRRANLQQKRQEAAEQKQKERLDYAQLCIRNNGGSISRKQLTAILMKKFELSRTTVTTFISSHIGNPLYEINGMIHESEETALIF